MYEGGCLQVPGAGLHVPGRVWVSQQVGQGQAGPGRHLHHAGHQDQGQRGRLYQAGLYINLYIDIDHIDINHNDIHIDNIDIDIDHIDIHHIDIDIDYMDIDIDHIDIEPDDRSGHCWAGGETKLLHPSCRAVY